MYKNRLICDDDALLGLKTMAALTAGFGQPVRGEAATLLRNHSGVEFMVWNRTGPTPVWAWAEQALSRITATAPQSEIDWQLVRSHGAQTSPDLSGLFSQEPGHIQFDPNRCDNAGEFVTTSILQVVKQVFSRVDRASEFQETSAHTRGIEYLTTASFMHRGHVLLHHLRKLEWHFSAFTGEPTNETARKALDLENSIIFAVVLTMMIKQQPLQQIIPIFGTQVNRARAEKIHRAYRQIQAYQPELKLIRLMKGPSLPDHTANDSQTDQESRPIHQEQRAQPVAISRPRTSPWSGHQAVQRFAAQPQRISWT